MQFGNEITDEMSYLPNDRCLELLHSASELLTA